MFKLPIRLVGFFELGQSFPLSHHAKENLARMKQRSAKCFPNPEVPEFIQRTCKENISSNSSWASCFYCSTSWTHSNVAGTVGKKLAPRREQCTYHIRLSWIINTIKQRQVLLWLRTERQVCRILLMSSESILNGLFSESAKAWLTMRCQPRRYVPAWGCWWVGIH